MIFVDFLFWCVTGFTLLTLTGSASFVAYFGIRKMFEFAFATSPVGAAQGLTAPVMKTVDLNVSALLRGIDAMNAAAAAGPWGPIEHALSPETAYKIERVMAVGSGMHNSSGNPCPHPIAPRVALAIVEALQGLPGRHS